MSNFTKHLQFTQQTKQAIYQRDNSTCIYCKTNYHMQSTDKTAYEIKDVMHYIPKSALGLGVEQNGAIGCRYHHHLLDNGNKGLREEMLELFEQHLKSNYKTWDKTTLTYSKYQQKGEKVCS